MKQILTFALLIIFVICLVVMRYVGLIGEISLVLLVFAGVLVGLFVSFSDRAKSINLRNGELVLSEIQVKYESILKIEGNIRELASAVMAMSEAARSAGWAMSKDEYQRYSDAKRRLEALL